MTEFLPARGLRSASVQSFLASFKLRRHVNARRYPAMQAASQEHILDAGEGVRLSCRISRQSRPEAPNVVLIHGWEGCHDSVYLHSMACFLYNQGWNVARFNLRDHGGTHGLNPEPFHSARMAEVFGGLRATQDLLGGDFDLVGFSLGGNFSLRVALGAPQEALRLRNTIAVNPVIDPHKTCLALDEARLYQGYFMAKWHKTVRAKRAAWPQGPAYEDLLRSNNFLEITRRFATGYCGFASVEDYFAAYTLRPDRFVDLSLPATIISAIDDAVIPVADVRALQGVNPHLEVCLSQYGGHCGYVRNLGFASWLEPQVLQRLSSTPVSGNVKMQAA